MQDVVQALRLLPMRASGYAPYVLAFKKLPRLAFKGALRAMSVDEVGEWGDRQIEEMLQVWMDIFKAAKHR